MLKQARMCPLPVLAQRIHTRYELRQNFNPRIGRNHTGSIISITGKSSTIVCINGNPLVGGSHGTFGWGVPLRFCFGSAPCFRLELLF